MAPSARVFARTRGTAERQQGRVARERFIPAHAGNGLLADRERRRRSVHPRARGEREFDRLVRERDSGSSPRTRGTVGGPAGSFEHRRFIPAHAGNGAFALLPVTPSAVHPRARGERHRPAAGPGPRRGSSPRTRGTGSPGASRSPQVAVHPRARGERCPDRLYGGRGLGSSPRTRGTAAPRRGRWWQPRFIPAHAGNGRWLAAQSRAWPVHPRARGERITSPTYGRIYDGSSPRTRGTGDHTC